jgi:hypothetical protein
MNSIAIEHAPACNSNDHEDRNKKKMIMKTETIKEENEK